MADRRKKSGSRSKKGSAMQPSIIRFNVAEETTEAFSRQPSMSKASGSSSSPCVDALSEAAAATTLPTATQSSQQHSKKGPQSLFKENEKDLELFRSQQQESSVDCTDVPDPNLLASQLEAVLIRSGASEQSSALVSSPEVDAPVTSFHGNESPPIREMMGDWELIDHPLAMTDGHYTEDDIARKEQEEEGEVEGGVFLIEDHYERPKEEKPKHLVLSIQKSPSRRQTSSKKKEKDKESGKLQDEVSTASHPTRFSSLDEVRSERSSQTSVSSSTLFHSHVFCSFLIFLFHVLSPSVYLTGVFDGALLAFLTTSFFLFFTMQGDAAAAAAEAAKEPVEAASQPAIPKKVIERLQPKPVLEDNFTAIRFYDDPTTHQPSLTTRVRLCLERHHLHITSLDRDTRMSFHHRFQDDLDFDKDDDDNNDKEATVSDTKIIDLQDADIKLVPVDISRKQRFSKKFPIRITAKFSLPDICQSLSLNYGPSARTKRIKEVSQTIYLFAPTSHDKELWFWRFDLASKSKVKEDDSTSSPFPITLPHFEEYVRYMGPIVRNFCPPFSSKSRQVQSRKAPPPPPPPPPPPLPPSSSPVKRHSTSTPHPSRPPCGPSSPIGWFNAFLGRAFWDAWNEPKLRDYLQRKWQHKLHKLKTPWFMRPLTITELSLGNHLPTITKAYPPQVDSQGIWVDLDLDYQQGTFFITMETSLNFMRTGDPAEPAAGTPLMSMSLSSKAVNGVGSDGSVTGVKGGGRSQSKAQGQGQQGGDSDIDSGAEDDEERAHIDESDVLSHSSESKHSKESSSSADSSLKASGIEPKSRLLRIAGKVANSRIMKKVGQTRLAQKISERVANTPLVLKVAVLSLRGRLTVHMTPPPTDRIWYGFRKMPDVKMEPTPQVGSRAVNFSKVTDWIEKKLRREIEKRFVLPHMEDLVIPVLESGLKPEHFL